MNPEIEAALNNHIVRDLSKKFDADISGKAGQVAGLARTNLERAFIVLAGGAALLSIGTHLLTAHYDGKVSDDDIKDIVAGYVNAVVKRKVKINEKSVGGPEMLLKLLKAVAS